MELPLPEREASPLLTSPPMRTCRASPSTDRQKRPRPPGQPLPRKKAGAGPATGRRPLNSLKRGAAAAIRRQTGSCRRPPTSCRRPCGASASRSRSRLSARALPSPAMSSSRTRASRSARSSTSPMISSSAWPRPISGSRPRSRANRLSASRSPTRRRPPFTCAS